MKKLVLKRKVNLAPANVCKLPYNGKLTSNILVVVDPFIGEDGDETIEYLNRMRKKFSAAMARVDDDTTDMVFYSACRGMTFAEWDKAKDKANILKEAHEDFQKLVRAMKPKLIICAGAAAAQQVYNRSVKITKIRGVPEVHEELGVPVFPVFGMLHVMKQPHLGGLFMADMATVKRIIDNKFSMKNLLKNYEKNYQWCYDIDFLLKKKPKIVSLDVETTGGWWFHSTGRILTVQLCVEEGVAYNIPINFPVDGKRMSLEQKKKVIGQLKQLLEDKDVQCIGHNLKYDVLYLFAKLGIWVANYAHDTLLMVHAIDENMISKSLDDCVRSYVMEMSGFNDDYNKDPEHQDKERMDLFSHEKMLQYGCGDVDATFRLFNVLYDKLTQDPKNYNCYQRVTMPAMRAFCIVEQEGFSINEKALKSFEKALAEHQAKEYVRLLDMIPKSIQDKHRNTGVGLKLTRDCILRDMLFTHKDGLKIKPIVFTKKSKQPSVSTKQHLPYFVEEPFVEGVIDYIKNEKMLNTFVKGFYKYIVDGKVRPSYQLHGTVTGRTSSKDPNGQNFPKRSKLAKEYRKIFVAPPGWVLIEADFSQVELRVAAIMANEESMLAVYRAGGDIHAATAAAVMGVTMEEFQKLDKKLQKEKRQQAKAVNFGFLYGMWWKKFRTYAKTDYGIDFTEQEAQTIRENFFKSRPNLEPWHRDMKNFVREHGFVRAFDGRTRHLPGVRSKDEAIAKSCERQAVNSPVQGFASDLGLMALGRMAPTIDRDKVKFCGFIHDAIVAIARVEHAGYACRTIKNYMQTNPLKEWFNFTSPIPLVADISLGFSLDNMHELGETVMNRDLKTARQLFDAVGAEYPVTEPKKYKLKRPVKLAAEPVKSIKKYKLKLRKAA